MLKFEKICVEKIKITWRKRDFIIVNVQNAHWMVLMWADSKTVLLFDTLSGKLTFEKPVMKQLIMTCFIDTERLIFQYGENKLQKNSSLTCGEHAAYFILYQNIFCIENGFLDLDYVSNIEKYCMDHNLDTDEFVWLEIYNKLKLDYPPDLRQVLNWYLEKQY